MAASDKEKLSLNVTLNNAWYAMTLASQICPGIIVHSFFLWIIGHGEWVFFDGVFMRVIVNALDKDLGFEHIIRFILISGLVFGLCAVYTSFVENVVYPLDTNRLFGGIYKKMYKKARNVELKCYEDADFYNRYTMAMDGAEEKVTAAAPSAENAAPDGGEG